MTIPHNTTVWLDRFRYLLDLEEQEARVRREEVATGTRDPVLEGLGVLLRKAVVVEERAAPFGRFLLEVAEDNSRPGHVEHFRARPGSIVYLRLKTNDKQTDMVRGVVKKRNRRSVTVVFDDDPEIFQSAVDIVLADDEVTLSRMRTGLFSLARTEGRAAFLLNVLAGTLPYRTQRGTVTKFSDENLNAEQREAICAALFQPDLALIHGPPGTGKTRVLVEVISALVERGEKVLCACASNGAIDHLMLQVAQAHQSLRICRVGHPARVSEALVPLTLEAQTETHPHARAARDLVEQGNELMRQMHRRSARGDDVRSEMRTLRFDAKRLFREAREYERAAIDDVVGRSAVIGGTLTGFDSFLPRGCSFDTLVVDEASQVLTPALLLALPYVKRIILAGDHKQLPPTVLSQQAEREGLSRTVFDELMTRAVDVSVMLRVQHRMNDAICAFPSTHTYGAKLVADPSVAHAQLFSDDGASDVRTSETAANDHRVSKLGHSFDVVDTAGAGYDEHRENESDSVDNPGEAAFLCRCVRDLIALGIGAHRVVVLTPYRAQVTLLASLLEEEIERGLVVETVDGFQGRERDVVIFSAVRSNGEGQIGFVADKRRLNVAITRARTKLLVVGDSATLSRSPDWDALFRHAMDNGCYRSVFEWMHDAGEEVST